MADLSITAANVKRTGGVAARIVKAGGTITPGMSLYLDSADNEYKAADANNTAKDQIDGVALTAGYDGADMVIGVPGTIVNIGATTTAGVIYTLTSTDAGTANGTAGGWCASSALGAGDAVCIGFVGNGTAIVTLILANTASAILA